MEKSKFAVEFIPTSDFEGKDVISFIVKRTYALNTFEAKLEVLDEQPPVLFADEFHDDGETDMPSVKHEGEIAVHKPKVDIVFLGKAYAPGGEPVPTFDCNLRVGDYSKSLRIYGPRTCTWQPPESEGVIDKKTGVWKEGEEPVLSPPLISEPEPVAEVELRLKNAYGGMSYIIPYDPEGFQKVLDDYEKEKEEAEKKKEEEKKKKEEEAAKAAEDEAKKPDNFFSDGGGSTLEDADEGVELGADGLPEGWGKSGAGYESDVDLGGWGVVGTAGEPPKPLKDGATKAIDLAELQGEIGGETEGEGEAEGEAGDSEEAYRRHVGVAGAKEAAPEVESGSTRFLKIEDNLEVGDGDWAEEQRKRLAEEDAARWAEQERLRKEQEEAEALPWPRIPCPQNPVGKGFALENKPETVNGLELPLIEDPGRPILPMEIPRALEDLMNEEKAILPARMCWFPKGYWPRAMRCGVMPKELAETQQKVDEQVASLDPDDPEQRMQAEATIDFEVPVMKPEYHNGAAPGLLAERVVGDEDVRLTNLDPSGLTIFKLPGDYPFVTFDRGQGPEPVFVRLDTLVIDREEERVAMVWRGTLPYGGVEDFETYPRFDVDVREKDVVTYRDEMARLTRERREAERGTQAIDLAALQAEEAERRYREHVDDQAGGAAAKEALATGAAAVVDGGTKMIDLSETGGEKVVTDSQFSDWVDEEKQREEEAQEEAESVAAKKERLRSKLQQMKEQEEAEAAAAAAEDSEDGEGGDS